MPDTRVYVCTFGLRVSPTAAMTGRSHWAVAERRPMRFDFDRTPPAAWVSGRRATPTIFANREEAERKVEDFLSRIRGAIRVGKANDTHPDIGSATLLFGTNDGVDQVGGYEIRDYAEFLAEKDEERRYHERVAAEKVAPAEQAAVQAQQVADQLRAELDLSSTPARPSTPGSGEWVAVPDRPKHQSYRRKDGTMSFRGRDGGQVSQGFDTIEEVQPWLDGDRTPKITAEQRARMEALESKVVRS